MIMYGFIFETMALYQDPGEGGQGLLGAVLVVAGDEDEVFAFAGSAPAFVDKRSLGLEELERSEETDEQEQGRFIHGRDDRRARTD